MAFHETSRFRRLNREWRQRLADSGFRDIEDDFGHVAQSRDYADLIPFHLLTEETAADLLGRPRETGHHEQDEASRDLLINDQAWEGSPIQARRAWCLMVTADYTMTAAARHVGWTRWRLGRALRKVLERGH